MGILKLMLELRGHRKKAQIKRSDQQRDLKKSESPSISQGSREWLVRFQRFLGGLSTSMVFQLS